MVPEVPVVVRPMREGDVPAVAAIEREAFTTPWKEETFRRLVDQPGTELIVVELPGEGVVGYAVLWCVLDQGELANIAIREDHRGRGLGPRLLDEVMAVARERGVRSLFLEVRVSNVRAIEMYEARGFREVGRRRDYYEKPREDAQVLAKRLDRHDDEDDRGDP